LDVSNEAHKKKIEDFFLGTEEDVSMVEGLRARDVEYFKWCDYYKYLHFE